MTPGVVQRLIPPLKAAESRHERGVLHPVSVRITDLGFVGCERFAEDAGRGDRQRKTEPGRRRRRLVLSDGTFCIEGVERVINVIVDVILVVAGDRLRDQGTVAHV
ncbi:hypothetical protein SDC9_205614 [bioreactor metagenome]|uniref:Uncharacterized protein n=1 Tax=bioreactor metagenome TaxID=1076179 RepID=A0A645J2K0_9ZZZZ